MEYASIQNWPVFDEYTVFPCGDDSAEPTHIMPVKGTEWRKIDLMQRWLKGRKNSSDDIPYLSVFEVELDDPWDIARWCSRFGMPGHLPHKLINVTMWPFWDNHHSKLSDGIIISQEKYNLYSGYELEEASPFVRVPPPFTDEAPPLSINGEKRIGEELTQKELKVCLNEENIDIAEPTFRFYDLFDFKVKNEPLDTAYGKYFPKLKKNIYPLPTAKSPKDQMGFWPNYGEPIYEIKDFIRKIRKLVKNFREKDKPVDPPPIEGEEDFIGYVLHNREQALENYYKYGFSRVYPTGLIPDEKRQISWEGPSLISAFLIQFMQDFEGQEGGLKKCKDPKCQKYFIPNNPRREYCSDKCRSRYNTEEHRKRQK